MKIVDLTPDRIDLSTSLCIGSKPGFEQAREEKRRWLEARLPNKIGVKLAYNDGSLAGMIEYSPIEDTPFPIVGKHILHIHCIWVLPNYQKNGLGEELVKSVIQEARVRHRSGSPLSRMMVRSSCRSASSPARGSDLLIVGDIRS